MPPVPKLLQDLKIAMSFIAALVMGVAAICLLSFCGTLIGALAGVLLSHP